MFGMIHGFCSTGSSPGNGWFLEPQRLDDEALTRRVHALHRTISAAQRQLLTCLGELETREAWLDDGAHDMSHWVSMQLGISYWKADRMVESGRALERLPHTAAALERGELCVDKVLELTRFATPDDEEAIVAWAHDVAPGAIRRRGDELRRSQRTEVEQIEEDTLARVALDR